MPTTPSRPRAHPPAPPTAPRRGRPARIDQARIVDAAIELGVDGLTMQALAFRLGVTTPALYTHVANRDEVLRLVADVLRTRVHDFAADTDDWRTWLRAFAQLVHDQLAPSAVSILGGLDRGDPVGRVGIAERGLELLMAEGLSPEEAGRAIWHVYRLALTSGSPTARMFDQALTTTESVLGVDENDRFPATEVVQHALTAAAPDPLPFDLDLVIDGISARIDRAATSPRA